MDKRAAFKEKEPQRRKGNVIGIEDTMLILTPTLISYVIFER